MMIIRCHDFFIYAGWVCGTMWDDVVRGTRSTAACAAAAPPVVTLTLPRRFDLLSFVLSTRCRCARRSMLDFDDSICRRRSGGGDPKGFVV